MPVTPRPLKSKSTRQSKAAARASVTRASSAGRESIGSSGLSGFAWHEGDASPAQRAAFSQTRSARRAAAPAAEGGAASVAPVPRGDVESIARAYLDRALEAPAVAS